MKKLRYSTGMKATVVVAQQVLFVILVISIVLVTTLFQKNILNFGDIKNNSFPTSTYFSYLFQESAENIFDFVELRKKFETDGNYDTAKQIDIRKYHSSQGKLGDMPDEKQSMDGAWSRRYYLGELVEWARNYTTSDYEFVSGYYVSDGIHQTQTVTRDGSLVFNQEKTIETLQDMSAELQEVISSNVEYFYGGSYDVPEGELVSAQGEGNRAAESGVEEAEEKRLSEVVQKVVDGRLYELTSEELSLLLQDMGMAQETYSSEYAFVDESYLSVDGRGIWDDYIQGNCTEVQMQKAYEALEYTLMNIGKEVNTYKKCLNRYNLGKEGSNVFYWVKMGNEDMVYTNLEDQKIEDLTAYGKKMGKYFFYQESDMRLETNVKGMEDVFYNGVEQIYGGKGNILFLCVDTSFPQEDSYYEAKQEYSRMYPWIYIGTVLMAISGLGCLICVLYLSTVAGKKSGTGEPFLCWFDKIPTELVFFGATLSVVLTIMLYGRVFYLFRASELAGLLIMSGVLTFFSTGLLMLFYFSFVRRIRSGVLWSGSICCWILRGISVLFQARIPATKIAVWFGIHLVACFVIIWLLRQWNSGYDMLGIICFIALSLVEGILLIQEGIQRNKVLEGIRNISSGDLEFKIDTSDLKGDNKKLAEAVNAIGDGLFHAVDDSMKNERLKADLITNVSHDIKTPLTSIINYVDLLKRENIQNERAQNYLAVLEQKSQRLKQLTEDLLEASKISSGNITLQMERINFVELVYQTGGEFNEKFEAKGLTAVTKLPREPVVIMADGRRIWRVVENLYNNVAKYAMANTRVYVDMAVEADKVSLSIKNISQNALNIQADELTERFIRGDVSRSTEGSGLGLSIAKNLTNLMGGEFEIYLDGDLFKVTISFKREPVGDERLIV